MLPTGIDGDADDEARPTVGGPGLDSDDDEAEKKRKEKKWSAAGVACQRSATPASRSGAQVPRVRTGARAALPGAGRGGARGAANARKSERGAARRKLCEPDMRGHPNANDPYG